MKPLTQSQINEIVDLLKTHWAGLNYLSIGPEAATPSTIAELQREGLIAPGVYISLVEYPYLLGKLRALLKQADYNRLSFNQIKGMASTITYTPLEQARLRELKKESVQLLRNVDADIRAGVLTALQPVQHEAITDQMVRQTVTQRIEAGVIKRRTFKEMATDVAKVTGDRFRDWQRVTANESWKAHNRGYVDTIIQGQGPYKDDKRGYGTQVRVMTRPDACSECKRDYLDNHGNPRIFTLGELVSNGNNSGPRNERKPIVPPHHPFCNCILQYVPIGFGYDDKGNFTLTDPEALKQAAA